MLAEIYLLKLEAAVRATKEAATTASTSRFVPVTYRLPRRSNPAFHTARLQVYPTELQLGAMSSYSIAPSRTARCDPGDRNRAARGQRVTKL